MVYGLDPVPGHLLLWPVQDRGADATHHHLGRHICQNQRRLQSHCLRHKVRQGAALERESLMYLFIHIYVSHPKYRLVLKEKVYLYLIYLSLISSYFILLLFFFFFFAQCPFCVFGNTDEPKPDAPAGDTETTSEAESKA